MGLFDWLEAGSAAFPDSKFGETYDNLFPGSYSISFGSTLAAVMPVGQMAHVYGDSIQYTIDWEGIIVDGFIGKIPGVGHALESFPGGLASGLLLGAGGYCNFVYGRNIGAVYGPTTSVQRGPTTTITGKSWLFGGDAPSTGKVLFAPPAPANAAANQGVVDRGVDIATTILSAIMILAGLTADVLAGTIYKVGSTDDDPHKQMNNILKTSSSIITNRIMGIIIAIEKFGQDTRNSIYRVPSMEDQLEIAKRDMASMEATISANKSDLERRLKQAEDDAYAAEQFLRAGLDQLSQAVDGANAAAGAAQSAADAAQGAADAAQQTANSAVDAANRTSLEVGNYEVAADGQIYFRANGAVMLEAMQDGGSILVDADSLASFRSGPAKLILQGTDPGMAILTSGLTGTTRLRAGELDLGSDIQLQPEETTIQVGAPDLGALIKLTPESITLSVGAPGEGASVSMTPESITIKVAESTWIISPTGIVEEVAEVSRELTAQGHNLTAAESELNLGPQGLSEEVPTVEDEVEATLTVNATIAEITTDGAKNEEASIIITE